MIVTKSKTLDQNGHILELGKATWNEDDTSVRNRYPTKSGGFNPRSSSEIPLHDIIDIVKFIAESQYFTPSDCIKIAKIMLCAAIVQVKNAWSIKFLTFLGKPLQRNNPVVKPQINKQLMGRK